MSMEPLEGELRKIGNPEDLKSADTISEMLKLRGVDIPLSVVETATPVAIKPFSKEALEFLKKKELLHYPLNRQSLKAQELAGRPLWYMSDADENFLTLPSMQSEVAFNPSPDKLFLPRSNMLTLLQQEEMTTEYSYKLQREFGSRELKVVIGDAPDYTSLAFLHLDATKGKERLFGAKYNYNCARTKTPTNSSSVADVGGFDADFGLRVNDWDRKGCGVDLWVFPLVVPASPNLGESA